MVLLACILAVLQASDGSSFDYSGLPQVDSPQIAIPTADVRFVLANRKATVTEVIVFKNTAQTAVDANLSIPRYRKSSGVVSPPTFPVLATWANAPMALTIAHDSEALPDNEKPARLTSAVHFGAGETIALRVSYSTPYGTTGYGGNQYVVGFELPGPSSGAQDTIPQLNISFAYSQKAVLGLPTMAPALDWAVSRTGASVRLANYIAKEQKVTATFYSGDFHSIH